MPVVLDAPHTSAFAARRQGCLEIALLNNMPDAALLATERQFIRLLSAAAGDRLVRLHLFSLQQIRRGKAAQARLQAAYSDIGHLQSRAFDALIVTGNEPRAASLSDEPYWPGLTAVVDWAEHNTVSTIWSCLAAHAAVLHLDGIQRRPAPNKHSGVFAFERRAEDPLLAGTPTPLRFAHSRWNGLSSEDLEAHGYQILTQSAEVGVDLFVKRWRSLFVFFQGHPEYDADSLLREYRRDVGRYLRGESPGYPAMPRNYFDGAVEQALAAFAVRAMSERDAALLAEFPSDIGLRAGLAAGWHDAALPVYRNWLSWIDAQRA